ncbi:MAG: lamin tail domain-containing protein, partial [Bacteroidia bacterium]|nr:lamin tail domain-containing protein [Bacteroidia bacterium]
MRSSKNILVVLFLLFSCFAKTQILDDFSDGDFTNAPAWVGNTTEYTVVANQLRSNSTTASTSFYLSTPATQTNNCQWEFWCNLQFNTSSANWVDVYLLADQSNLMSATLNGYFVRIGNTTDEVSLYKNTSGTATKIIDGADGTTNQSNTLLKVKVVRDIANQFTLSTDFTGTGTAYGIEGTITDGSFLTANSFGLVIKQSTASFFQKHFFDDFYAGAIVTDVAPPQILSSTAISSTQLDVYFNENLDPATSQTAANYVCNNGVGAATVATLDALDFTLVHLTFGTPFTNALSNTLTVNAVQDVAGNPIVNGTTNFVFYNIAAPVYKDVIITEIMADANPAVGTLPVLEFVEIYNNTSTKTFDLNAWKFSDAGGTNATINSKYLLPGQYAILCKNADTASFSPFGLVVGMSTMPALNDAGDDIYLNDNLGNFIDSVNYDISWYHDGTKDGGGWTLELINPNIPLSCSAASNWTASNNTNGGTPGQQNSVYSIAPDVTGPIPQQVSITDSLHITVCFNEMIDATQVTQTINYSINNSIGNPSAVSISGTNTNCVDLTLSVPLQNQTNYSITFSGMADCSGNAVSPSLLNFSYYVPGFNDIVINELLPDPDPPIGLPNYEYVELYNRTAYNISLNNWTISSPTSTKTIPNIVILPDSFVILTGSSGFAAYSALGFNVYEVTSFPALTNAGSTITLKNSNAKIINSVTYSDSWYHDATKQEGGYSLEMIDPLNPCGEENNWTASNSIYGGTPGFQNSVYASNADNASPKLKRIAVNAVDTIQLFFDEKIDSSSMLSASIYSIDNLIG